MSQFKQRKKLIQIKNHDSYIKIKVMLKIKATSLLIVIFMFNQFSYAQDGNGKGECSDGKLNGAITANFGETTGENQTVIPILLELTTACFLGEPGCVSSNNRHNNVCDTVCNGQASVWTYEGVPPYTYLWNTGATDSIISGLCAGTYSCTVTDSVGNTDSLNIKIIDTNYVNTSPVAGPAAVYSGDTATYTVNNNTGSYYTWSASGGTIISGISAYQVTVVWGPAGMGTISTYEVDSGFCVGDIESLNVIIGANSSLEEEQEQHQIVVIYPNPFTESTVIAFENTAGASFELRVLDLSGKLIRERSGITGTRFVFRRDGMANGIYFLELRSKDQVFLGKLVLE